MKKIIFSFMLIIPLLIFSTCVFAEDISLSWDPPTINEDGTPLTDLAGYKVYYGNISGSYTKSIDVNNVTIFTVKNLTDGVWYFAVTAYDTSGNESNYSNEVNKKVDILKPSFPFNLIIL